MTTFDIVVPSYGRPQELGRCLEAAAALAGPQRRLVAVLRPGDRASREAVAGIAGVDIVDVHHPGHLPPLAAALGACRGDVMAVLDDDAVPTGSWLEGIVSAFRDPRVVGVTGPVFDHSDTPLPDPPDLRRLQRSRGRTWYRAFHGLSSPAGAAVREVPRRRFLVEGMTGCNMAFRREALAAVGVDQALNRGAAVNYEADLALGLVRRGLVLFDTDMAVDHYPAPRGAAPSRDDLVTYIGDYTANLYYIAGKRFSPAELLVFLPVMAAVGQRVSPGVLRWGAAGRRSGLSAPVLGVLVARSRWKGLAAGLRARRRYGPLDNILAHAEQGG